MSGVTRTIAPALTHGLVFAPIGDDRTRTVARRLRQAIILGILDEEEALPTEAQLATRFGVATVTVRAALADLRVEGWIETRRGRGGGSFVRRPSAETATAAYTALNFVEPEELRDLGDYHTAIAGAGAALAAERADRTAAERLRYLASRIAKVDTAAAAVRADSRFHIEVAAGGRSARLAAAEMAAQAELSPLLWMSGITPPLVQEALAEHHAIAEAIHARQSQQARELAEAHVADAVDRLIQIRLDQSTAP